MVSFVPFVKDPKKWFKKSEVSSLLYSADPAKGLVLKKGNLENFEMLVGRISTDLLEALYLFERLFEKKEQDET